MVPSQEQQEIILSDKNTIVISNPGTGKTTTLAWKAIRLLENGVKSENILCITFTEKAKKEMFEKIFEMAKGKFPDSEIMKLNIHTFHSYAYDYLTSTGLVTGGVIGNNVMRYSILKSFEKSNAFHYAKDYMISTIVPKTENAIRYIKSFGIMPDTVRIDKVNSLIEKCYVEGQTSYSLNELKAFLQYFIDAYRKYEESKQGSVDYSDMLLMFVSNFKGKKFKYVLVDEMQDMNDLEARIAQMTGENIFLVGDAKQAIFGFQGGSIKNFQKFRKSCDQKLLSLNRRSCQQILDYSKKHFLNGTQHTQLFAQELENFQSLGKGEIPKLISTNAHLAKILCVIEENPEKTIGIITRTNRQIIEISQYLDINRIKYSSTSTQATSEHAKIEIVNYLKGLVSDRVEDKISAAFTSFSSYTLKEAFELSEAYHDKDSQRLKKIQSWGMKMNKNDIDILFNRVIFPQCVSKGPEWFTTAIVVKEQIDQYLVLDTPTREGLFDFISITEESYIERDVGSKITLTTVHKAKGRDFDIVVYIPSSAPERTSFVDTIVKSILESNGIDIRDELEEESLRIDFVAFTRAKQKLIIITDGKNAGKYHIESLSEIEIDEKQDQIVSSKLDDRLSEAYSLFLSGRFQDSQKLLKSEDEWLKEFIFNYFNKIDHFSYSIVQTDAYEFLINNIISIPTLYPAADFGSKVHTAIANISNNKSILEDFHDDVKRAAENASKAVDQLRKEYPGLRFMDAEKKRELPLSTMIECEETNLMFKGTIDAIFQHDKGYLIIDYKTDKNTTNSSKHKRQLAVYRKMHSKLEDINEENIKIAVVFVALRGGINTGKFDWQVEKEIKNAYPTFEKHIAKILGWKRDPNKFITDLLENPKDDLLYERIKEKLLDSS